MPATQASRPEVQEVETGIEAPRRAGLFIALLVFGVFGVWAAFAPIQGAAHAPGTVTVRSYKKTIQHLEGGMINRIFVQNGDHVEAGDVILELDGTQSLAQLEIANAQATALMALEARLIAERDGLETVAYPAALSRSDANASTEMAAQDQVFHARKAAHDGNIAVLEQRIEQLRSRVEGLKAMKESKELLAASFNEELQDTRILLEQGFSDKLRLRELERNFAAYKGEAAELLANISSTQMQVGETQLQILQVENEFRSDVVTQLSDTQTRLKDVRERITALNDVVERTHVRAPVSGVLTGMQYHTEGGVVGPGAPIAEVVPQSDELIIESRVSPIDIDRVHTGQEATIRFSSFSSRTPTIYGTVLSVSADAMAEQQTGMPYYLARVAVNPEGMEALGDLTLVPGMPAEVFISSGPRTFLQYVMKPFSNAMARSLIED
ncbi:MAG: HlyD family type I secretion periplasmic adaptor subunit [Pseudomonadales bacterium]|nr:HlyD family type I secretion periplasmic adaptor subunit [Pseudomonadales bacterium]MCP5344147.1 HlyD family type I secretion periplasmic adaptor subunit [Pseudomonadales bacterium]